MARKPRPYSPGAIHHVTACVIRDQKLYKDEQDKNQFLKYLKDFLLETGFLLYSLQLYEKHYHMILRINHLHLKALLGGFHSAYARYYNKRYGLHGYFFQGRPKATVIEDGQYIRNIIYYTNTGPLRAGICQTLAQLDILPGATHSAIMGFHQFPFLQTADILSIFGDDSGADPKTLYREFIRQGVENLRSDEHFFKLVKGSNKDKQNRHEPGYWVIGSTGFVKDAIERDTQRRIRVAQYKLSGWDQEKLAIFVASLKKVDVADLRTRGYRNSLSDARKLYCYLAIRVLEMSSISTANRLNVSSTAAGRLARQGKIIAEQMQLVIPDNPEI